MENNALGLIIALSSFGSFIVICGFLKYCRDIYREKNENIKLNNTRRKLMASKRIKPISLTIIDEEIKSKSEIRSAEENV